MDLKARLRKARCWHVGTHVSGMREPSTKWLELNPATPSQAADRIEALEALLGECRLQLEHLDERSPTGTTPAVIARIDALLREGGE